MQVEYNESLLSDFITRLIEDCGRIVLHGMQRGRSTYFS